MPETRSDSQARERPDSKAREARERPDSEAREQSDSEAWERPDLRDELIRRLRDPETRQRIADALITEASGGPPDPKSGQPKGGASVIRAFELIREIALERPERSVVAAWNLAAYTDAELTVMLARLESNSAEKSRDAAESWDGVPEARDGPETSGAAQESHDGAESWDSVPKARGGAAKSGAEKTRDGAESWDGVPKARGDAETSGAEKARDGVEKSRSPPETRDGGKRFGSYD